MTELRDARLKQALAHAPDAHMTPDARTRAAVRAMAVATSAPRPVGSAGAAWWRRLWQASGNSRGPWGAALATVVLATLVTVLWRDEEIPGARTADAPMATAPAARSTQAPSVALPSTGVPAAAPATVPAPAIATAPAPPVLKPAPVDKAAKPEPARALRPEQSAGQSFAKKAEGEARDKAAYVPAPAPVQQAPAQESQGAVVADAQPPRREDERRRTAERSRSDNAVAPSAPPVGSSAAASPAAATPVAPGAAAPAPPPVALAVPARPVAPAAAARASVPAPDLSAVDAWTQARVSLDGRVSVIMPGGHGVLVAQLRAVASQARGAGVMAGPIVARIELLRGDEVLGTLVVGEASVQWTVRRGGMDTSFSGVVPASQVIELLEEVRRAR